MNLLPFLKKNGLQILILALPFVVAAVFWQRFPARVASHWNSLGQPNGWMSKGPGLLLLPALNLGVWALFAALPFLDPKIRASREPGRMTEALRMWCLALTFFLGFVSLLGMAFAAGLRFDMNRLVINGMLLMFLVIGNFMGNMRPNYFAGIRTPWTLEDPEIWRATHRIGGRILVYGCLVLLLAQGFFTSTQWLNASLVFLVGWAIWGVAYSYWRFRVKNRAAR